MTIEAHNPEHRAWRHLSDEQRAVAAELVWRAGILHAEADGELSMAEAVALAAVQIGHRVPTATPERAE